MGSETQGKQEPVKEFASIRKDQVLVSWAFWEVGQCLGKKPRAIKDYG